MPARLTGSILAGTEKDDPAITATRGIAAVSVLCAHAFDYASNKHAQTFFASFGVCVFFIITGYLFFSMVLLDRFNLNTFFRKRILRLVPAAFVAIAIIQFLDWAQWGFHAFDTRQLNAILRNFMFGFVGDMFGVTAINDLASIVQKMGMIWTLKWEWLFYVTFPVAIAFAGKSLTRLVVFTLTLYVMFYPPSDLLITSTGNYMILFLLGAACAKLVSQYPGYKAAFVRAGWVAWLGVLCIYVYHASVERLMGGQLLFNLLITAPFFLLMVKTGQAGGVVAKVIRSRGVQILGVISYSFYLYHMTVIYYSQHLVRSWIPKDTAAADYYTFATLIPVGCLVIAVAVVSYLKVEHRFMIHKAVPNPARAVTPQGS